MAEQRKNYNQKRNNGNGGQKRNQKKAQNAPKNYNINKSKAVAKMNVEGRAYEYKMSAECARNILKDRKGKEASMNPQQYLCEFVTEQYGLLGTCVKVLTY